MDIKQKNIDDLNAVLTVKISKKDYNENYENSLKKYRKQVQLPGFRQGHVPTSVVKKKYGPSILAEEIDKLINESLYKHITENNLNVLGNPMPKVEEGAENDWYNPGDFEFSYEIGLAPEFDVKLGGKEKYDYYKVKVDNDLINQQVEDFAKRYGKLVPADKSEDKDMIMAQFTELDEKDNPKEGGFVHSSTIAIDFVEDAKAKKQLIGLKAGDTLVVDPKKISRGDADMGAMLGLSKEAAAAYSNKVSVLVTEVKRLMPAELNQELFDKIYGPGVVSSEEEFKAKIQSELETVFSQDVDKVFKRDFADKILGKLNLALPDEFLKRWILESNKETITHEQLESEYQQYADSLRWQLVENKIIKDNELQVGNEEVVDYTKDVLGSQYAQYGMMIPEDDELTKTAMSVLSNQEEAKKIYDMLYDQKVLNFLKENVKLKEIEVNYDDFVKVASKS